MNIIDRFFAWLNQVLGGDNDGLAFIFKKAPVEQKSSGESESVISVFDLESWFRKLKEAESQPKKTAEGYGLGALPSIQFERSLPKELNPVIGDIAKFSEAMLKSGGVVPIAFVEAFGSRIAKGVGEMVSAVFSGPESIFKVYNLETGQELIEKEGPGSLYRMMANKSGI